ncbi:Concanavalin A-like lectin/glucanases superfamily protein [Paenibacillus sp. UNCCL117]|uniref:exo-alpha-sialidase n=1 Tax=unclassified Paenibacillus TaxID=185978 RepID=UPI0008811830|nr:MULTISPECIES: exo-alpha-sialidase [unclassified Paenibacillus]SDE65111.1 Concanavalin A-like lectin/glucanases superfamily protein [Paenibacillus sp. cl123]SFW70484.1 Concanavalin A-like lectin/glucanases superfamily protein [Paenibacillus sp. UNCCL117]
MNQTNRQANPADVRHIAAGIELPKKHYCDQPYTVITPDGNWLCVMTTGTGAEGEADQHIVATISEDEGRTWSELIDIEPPGPPESSWVTPFLAPGGRVYVFYTYNSANMREVQGNGRVFQRVDTLGDYVFKYSDDNGRTWSSERYPIPVRAFAIDRGNPYGGEVRFFWSVCKPIVHKGDFYVALSKVGNFGVGFMESSEGVILRSDNLLTEPDPGRIRWETLPGGDIGLRAPASAVADEHNLVSMDDGSLYCIYRTVEGSNCAAYSRDDGRTWTEPAHAVYTPGGRKLRHPRAANFVRKFSNGRYLLWFHNHGHDCRSNPAEAYLDRNPAWFTGGIEKDGFIHWSEPEIVLYDDNPNTRISYPDFLETADGRFYITETQKTIARIHQVDRTLLEGLWQQHMNREITDRGLVLAAAGPELSPGASLRMPALPELSAGGGFTLDLWVSFRELKAGQVLLDTRDAGGRGIVVKTTEEAAVSIMLSDGRTTASWDSDPGLLQTGAPHHLVIIVDGGPKAILFVIDGRLCDGGERRPFGFGRFSPFLKQVGGSGQLAVAPSLEGTLHGLRLYDRYLRVSEAVGNFRAGLPSRG